MTRRTVLGAAAGATCGSAGASEPGFAALDAGVEAAVAGGAAPWMVLWITDAQGDIHRTAVGVGLDHVDVLRSATKIATVTAVMSLVQDGRIGLDDPVARHLPAFGGAKAGITLRRLLSMNSGLPSLWPAFSDEVPLAVAADVIAQAPLAAPPGERFIYGNLGLTVAGRVAEIVSGRPWDDFFAEAVARPLGIDFTYGPLDTGRLGGGGRTRAGDYAKLLRLHLSGGLHEGKRLFRPALIEEMQRSNGSAFTNPLNGAGDFKGYGMGWWFDELESSGEPRVISDPGLWGAYPWLDRRRRYAGLVFMRGQLKDGAAVYRQLRPQIERILDARAASAT